MASEGAQITKGSTKTRTRRSVLADSSNPRWRLRRTVTLIGLMGSGKSAVGRRLAQELGVRFIDADSEIEAAAGMTIPEIFEKFGEPYFREREREVIARLYHGEPFVLAFGGGAFINPETRALAKRESVTVWLRADLEVLVGRVARKDSRPLLKNRDPREVLSALIEQRYPIYAEAALTVDTRDEPHEAAVRNVLTALRHAREVTRQRPPRRRRRAALTAGSPS